MKPVYFFGANKPNGYLSNWYAVRFIDDNTKVQYHNTEQYMMHQKALLFNDTVMAEKILYQTDPRKVKALGRKVAGFDEQVWEKRRFDVVVEGNRLKFSQNPDLKKMLLETKGRLLVEASPFDKVWGIGMTAEDAAKTDPSQWRGLNLLGKALVKVRDELL